DPIGLGKRCHEPPEDLLEGLGLQNAEDPAERIGAGDPVLQSQELPQQRFLRAAKQRHVRRAFRSAQHRSQRDDKDIEQFVQRVRRSWIWQASENPGEFLHRNPHAIRESFSESILPTAAIATSNPHAIPLHVDGEYVARMEEVLDLYAEAPDRKRPVVCFDESPVQLIGEVRQPIPATPGQLERYDYEYRRNGTVNLFVLDVH